MLAIADCRIYISELAPIGRRGLFTAMLQTTVNIGMTLATVLVMILTAAISHGKQLLTH